MRARLHGQWRRLDLGAAIVFLAIDVVVALTAPGPVSGIALALVVHGGLSQHRDRPVVAAILVTVGVLARTAFGVSNLTAELPLVIVAYSLGTVVPQRFLIHLGVSAGVIGCVAAASSSRWLLAGAVAAAAGVVGSTHRRHDEQLREQRLRIAADLHDTVGHHLSAIGVRTYLLDDLVAGGQPALTQATSQIRENARAAVTDLGALVARLRGEPGARERGIDGVPELVRVAEAAGNEVDLRLGELPEDLPPEVGAEIYWVLREALTNVVRHSSPTRVVVRLEVVGADLVVSVTNERCRGDRPRRRFGGTGFGVRGMRERVRRLGGRLEAAGVPGGGYRVLATVPLGRAMSARTA